MTLADLHQVQSLSPREKLELVDEIWKSVASHPEQLEVTQEEKDILDRRWADFVRNPSSALTIEEFKGKISALRA